MDQRGGPVHCCPLVALLGAQCSPTSNQSHESTDQLQVKNALTSECTDVAIMDLQHKVGYSGVSSHFKSDIWRQKEKILLDVCPDINGLVEKAVGEHIFSVVFAEVGLFLRAKTC